MDILFLILLVFMLLLFGYAQLQRGVVKTPGRIITTEEEEAEMQ